MRFYPLPSYLLRASVCLMAASAAPVIFGATTILPVAAIEDLWTLPAAEFRQKYSGINVTGLGPTDEGWYVRYRHENLTYLFGPIADREEAQRKKWDMESVREAAVKNRGSLASSQVDYVRFTFSGVYGRRGASGSGAGDGGSGGAGTERVSADGRSGPEGDWDGDGIPNNRDEDRDGDGINNDQDPDADGDGVPNGEDQNMYGTDQNSVVDGANGPGGDLDGDGIANASDGDIDGDGTANAQDGDEDGDGVPNAEDTDRFGNGSALAGGGGQGKQGGSRDGSQGEGGESMNGGQDGAGQQGRSKQVASNSRGSRGNQQQSGSNNSGDGQGQQSSSSSGSSGGQPGNPSQGGGPPGPPSSGGSGGNPLQLLTGLLRRILGL